MQEIENACQILAAGGLVAFPTETVYGLGADACNEHAIRKIFAVKGRPLNHPLIVHLASENDLPIFAREIPEIAWQIVKEFWPGPLTIVLKKTNHVSSLITGGQNTIALRCPSHPKAQHLLKAFGSGIVAPSANRFTHLSPTSALDVRSELGDDVDYIIDGGRCSLGLESTIINLVDETPQLLRPGMISIDKLAKFLGRSIESDQGNKIKAPGMHKKHYAPRTKTSLLKHEEIISFIAKLSHDQVLTVAAILYNDISLDHKIQQIKMPKNPTDYAHQLYHQMRLLDNDAFTQIIIEDVPYTSEWATIRDRLIKATGT